MCLGRLSYQKGLRFVWVSAVIYIEGKLVPVLEDLLALCGQNVCPCSLCLLVKATDFTDNTSDVIFITWADWHNFLVLQNVSKLNLFFSNLIYYFLKPFNPIVVVVAGIFRFFFEVLGWLKWVKPEIPLHPELVFEKPPVFFFIWKLSH